MAPLESPFAVLTAVVAPALLTNSSTVLVLGLGNRIARVVDRTRAVAGVMASAGEDSELYQRLQQQAALLAYSDNFRIMTGLMIVCLPLLLLFHRPGKHEGGPAEIAAE